MYTHRNKEDSGYNGITDEWSPYRGKYPEPTAEELRIIRCFLRKFAWELDDFDESQHRWISLKNRLQCPNLRDLLRTFIRQVRATKGYDVDLYFDFIVHPNTVFVPRSLDDKKFYVEAMAAAKFAIHQINSMQRGQSYELVRVDKMVSTTHKLFVTITNLLLLTFTVKKKKKINVSAAAAADADANVNVNVHDSDRVVKTTTIQAMVNICDQDQLPSSYLLKEWKYKPLLTHQ